MLFFALSGLDIMNALEISDKLREDIINWVYAQQILPSGNGIDLIHSDTDVAETI